MKRIATALALLPLIASSVWAASPVVDGTPTKSAVSIAANGSFATSYPPEFSGAGHTGDCCAIFYAGNMTGDTEVFTCGNWTQAFHHDWDNQDDAHIWSHVYTDGDTAPTCTNSLSTTGSYNLICWKHSNGCTFRNAFVFSNNLASTTVTGASATGNVADLHIFFTSATILKDPDTGPPYVTFSAYNNSLTQEVQQDANEASTAVADVRITTTGAQTASTATLSADTLSIGIEAALESEPGTCGCGL